LQKNTVISTRLLSLNVKHIGTAALRWPEQKEDRRWTFRNALTYLPQPPTLKAMDRRGWERETRSLLQAQRRRRRTWQPAEAIRVLWPQAECVQLSSAGDKGNRKTFNFEVCALLQSLTLGRYRFYRGGWWSTLLLKSTHFAYVWSLALP